MRYLSELVAACRSAHTRLVVIVPPIFYIETLIPSGYPAFISATRQVVVSGGATYIDYDSALHRQEYRVDPSHLYRAGARELAPLLASDLAKVYSPSG